MNLRPSGYEPDELPDCSTPRRSRGLTVPVSSGGRNPGREGREHWWQLAAAGSQTGTVAAAMGLFRRKPSVDPAQLAAVAVEVAALRQQLDVLARRLDTGETDRRQLADVVGALQQRVASVGTELTNQLSELSGEIDTLQARPDPTAAIAAVGELRGDLGGLQANVDDLATAVQGVEDGADGLRTGQERLANEQARYQIAFRDEIASLADQLARKRT